MLWRTPDSAVGVYIHINKYEICIHKGPVCEPNWVGNLKWEPLCLGKYRAMCFLSLPNQNSWEIATFYFQKILDSDVGGPTLPTLPPSSPHATTSHTGQHAV